MRIEKILIMLVLILAALMVVNFEIISTKTFKNNDNNKLHGYIVELDEPVAFLKNKNFIIKDFAIILR